jgi:hypothetical protein
MTGRGSETPARLLLALGAVGVAACALIAGEWVSRRLTPDYLVARRGLHVSSPVYGWSGRPNAAVAMGGGLASLNARGYRGRELGMRRRGDPTRVVVIGDSIAFGYGVADSETFSSLLDRRENGIEVANFGVQGYGPGQELLVLLHEGLRLAPDLVVLAICLRNDFADAVLPVDLYDGATPRPRFRLVNDRLVLDDSAMPKTARGRATQWLADYSHLFNRAANLAGKGGPADELGWRVRKQQALRDPDHAFRLSLALIEEMNRLCAWHGVALLVATFPNGLSYETPPGLPERLGAALRAERIWHVDMGKRFGALGLTPAMLSLDRTGHPGPRGHAVASEILEQEIVRPARQSAPAATIETPPAEPPQRASAERESET